MDGITDSMDMSLSKLREIVKDRKALCAAVQGLQRVGHDLATEKQQQLFQRPHAEFLFLWNWGISRTQLKLLSSSSS